MDKVNTVEKNSPRSRQQSIDMTTGSIMGPVVLFALPILFANLLQQLYTTVDTLIIGRFCSATSLAAVGTSSLPTELLLCIFIGIGNGVSIIVSQFKGSGDLSSLKSAIRTSIFFIFIVSIPITFIGQFLGPLILKMINTPTDTWDFAVSYVRVMFFATLANLGYNMNAGILRGLGDSKASLIFLGVSCVINIALDIVFIAFMGMDVFGAALATAIAIVASWLFSIFYIKIKYPELEFSLLPKGCDMSMLKRIIKIGVPLGLNNSIYSIGHIVISSIMNLQGAVFIAGCSVAGKITGIANMAITSFSSAATTFSGQNYGARKLDRLKKGSWLIPLCNGLYTVTAGLIVVFFLCDIVVGFFTEDAAVIEVATRYVHVVLPFSWCYAVLNSINCYANGAGDVKYPTIVNILMLWAVRIPAGYLINYFTDGQYLMAVYPISFAFGMICNVVYLFTNRWKKICGGEYA